MSPCAGPLVSARPSRVGKRACVRVSIKTELQLQFIWNSYNTEILSRTRKSLCEHGPRSPSCGTLAVTGGCSTMTPRTFTKRVSRIRSPKNLFIFPDKFLSKFVTQPVEFHVRNHCFWQRELLTEKVQKFNSGHTRFRVED